MKNRKFWIYTHLILAAFFMPYLLLMPTTGSLYLLGFPGTEVKTEAFRINGEVPAETEAQENYFREQFRQQGIDFNFEYIRGTSTNFVFRPTTRTYYTATKNESGEIVFTRVEPNLLKRLIELHKGHGPQAMRWLEIAFGMGLILITLSGLWLAWTVKPYRKAALLSFVGGSFLIVLVCLL